MKNGTIKLRNEFLHVYEVKEKNALTDSIIPFFNKFHFLSDKKKKDFSRFKKLMQIIFYQNKTKNLQYIQNIVNFLNEVSFKNNFKYKNAEILDKAFLFFTKNKNKIEKLNTKNYTK